MKQDEQAKRQGRVERVALLAQVESWLEKPMLALSLLWLVLLVIELTAGLSPFLEWLGIAIWALFVIEFGLRFVIAPQKAPFLKSNWLTLLALVTPALRLLRVVSVLRALRVARATRGLRVVKLVGSLNRSIRSLRRTLGRRRFGYVVSVTLVVLVLGSAGIYSFESEAEGGTLRSYGDSLWFTAMILTTLGSDFWPASGAGRALAFLLALYAFAVFGYLTATLASFFIGRDAEDREGEVAGSKELREIRAEIAALRNETAAARSQEQAAAQGLGVSPEGRPPTG